MDGQEFGPLVKRAAAAKGLSQGRLGYLLTDDDGPFIDSSRVRLLYEGKWRLTHATVERLINILAPHLDAAEAWASSGLLPPGVTADHLRQLDLAAVGAVSEQADPKNGRTWRRPGERRWADRRQRDRRHIWLVPAEPAA